MLNNILTYKDFQEIYEHCSNSRGSYAIKDFADDIFREFGKSNTNLALSIMEFIESKYKPLEGHEGLCQKDYLNFAEELPGLPCAAIEYFYSYLTSIIGSSEYSNQRKRNIQKITFETNIDRKKLRHVLEKLKKEQFCNFSSFTSIHWVFEKGDQTDIAERIIWIDQAQRSKDTNYQTLVFFLEKTISNIDFQDRGFSSSAVFNRFRKQDGTTFDKKSFKSVIQRYRALKRKGTLSPRMRLIEEILR